MENAPSLTRSRKTLSILLAVVMIVSTLQIPIFVQPPLSILSFQRKGSDAYATILVQHQLYHAFAHVNGSVISLTGMYDNNGVPQIGFCWEMAPMPTNGFPLRTPQCGGGGCCKCYYALCYMSSTFIDTTQSICKTPYNDGCVPAMLLYLDPTTALQGQVAVAGIVVLCGLLTVFFPNPLTGLATAVSAVIAYSYSTLYQSDKPSDGSFVLWTPTDAYNAYLAFLGTGSFWSATTNYWWRMNFDGSLPFPAQHR